MTAPASRRLILPITILLLLAAPPDVQAQAQLFWSDADAGVLARAGIDGTGVEEIVRIRLDSPAAVEVDPQNGKVYWAGLGEVGRADLDGSNVEAPITLGEEVFFRDRALSVAIHAGDEKIYWLSEDRIYRANFDGSDQEEAVSSGIVNAEDIAIDEAAGKIYWTNNSFSSGGVKRSDLDGSNQEDIVTGLFSVKKLALDVDGGKVYYTDLVANDVYRADLDGSSAEAIVEDQENPEGLTLDLVNQKVYWTDITDDVVRRANLDGSGVEDLPVAVERPLDVAVDPDGNGLFIVIEDGALIRTDLDGNHAETFVVPVGDIREIAVDEVNGKIYWGDQFGLGRLQRADLDGSNIEDVHDQAAESMFFDASGGKIYWSVRSALHRADPDGSNRETLVETNDARQIVVDPSSGRMFWFGDANPPTMVMSANLDGSDVQTVADNLSSLDHLTLDSENGYIFWYGSDGDNGVFRAGVDGSGAMRITDGSARGGVAVYPQADKVYWSDRSIYRSNLDGSSEEELVESSTGFTMSGLTVDAENGLMYWATTDQEIRRAGLDGSSPETIVTGVLEVLDMEVSNVTDTHAEVAADRPVSNSLMTVYPNPFSTSAVLEWRVEQQGSVKVTLHDVLGRRVEILHRGAATPGDVVRVRLDRTGLADGVYFIRGAAAGSVVSRPIVIGR